jgi:hypothetical protein
MVSLGAACADSDQCTWLLRIIGIFALPCEGTLYDMTTSPRYIPTAMIQGDDVMQKLLHDW